MEHNTYGFAFHWIMGLTFGIEHFEGDNEDDFYWMVGLSVGVIRLLFMRMKM